MKNEKIPVLVLTDVVIFPNNEVRIEYDDTFDKKIIDLIDDSFDKLMIIVNPIDDQDTGDITNLPKYGVLGQLKLKINVPNGKTRVVIEGIKRISVGNYDFNNGVYEANFTDIKISDSDDKNYFNILIKSLERYISKVPYMSNAIMSQLNSVNDLTNLCDLIASFLPVSYEKKKKYIYTTNDIERAKLLIKDMNEDLKFIELEREIESEVEKEIDESQREFFLREKIKVIKEELGDVNSKDDEVEILRKKINKLKCSNKIKEKMLSELSRYETISSNSPELGMIRDYLDWMVSLPWNKYTKDNKDFNSVSEILDSTHYGLKDVKTRILEYLAVKENTNNLRSPIICLVGPPGVGKTSLAVSIAKSLGRKTAKISVGGINDEAEIVGHRRTYIGSIPGRIIQGIRKAKTSNPVFIIDEIDKMTKGIKGDPASSLLEVLDPEQNSKFSDHYIEEEFDLSKVLFIATANYIDQIPYELRDRLEIIELSSYTEYEKLDIAKKHLIPRSLEEHGLTTLQVNIEDEAILTIIRNYTKEAGVRELDRIISSLFRKIVKKILVEKEVVFYNIDNKNIEEFLGKKKYLYEKNSKEKEIGVVNGMAYTAFGGDILPIEATLYKGKGKLTLTGSLGDVMQESCKIAYSYIKSNSKKFNIDEKILNESDIHIHFPEGAISKDGPSAGITITTALISLFKNIAVDKNISMTGEITLRGKVLAIGGLKEKIIGSHRAGIRKIILPKENKKDLDDIPEDIKKDIKFIFVDNYSEIFNKIFKGSNKND
ncbi:MAG: endopeptidase La [Bacilli bacterium]|nr:endopeptidase La [Bacilli bacterium]MBR3049689.1 endopeptidase La [Bacilli bacterium]